MSDEQNPEQKEEQKEEQKNTEQAPQQQLAIQKIYCKDISFETPNSPKVFTESIQPEMKTELNTTVNVLADNTYEVVLTVTVTAEFDNKTAFLAEVNQAGIFNISGFDKANLDGLLGSYCPNVLFSYAREAVGDIVTKGGFPQLVLQPVNFDAMYNQHLQARQQQAATEAEKGTESGTDAVH
jgi:preprotein translocase subunit SecB